MYTILYQQATVNQYSGLIQASVITLVNRQSGVSRFFGGIAIMDKRLGMVVISSTAVVLGALMLVSNAFGNEAAPAAAKMCLGCHGKDGVSTRPTVPSIAGISAPVHADALYAYRDGTRECADPKSKMMCTLSAKLSDEQIEELAEYFAGRAFKPAEQDFDAAKAASGAKLHEASCEKCHTAGGSEPLDDSSILAGQWLPYMQMSLTQFARGERDQPKAMQVKFEQLSEADLEALAHFYASQQ